MNIMEFQIQELQISGMTCQLYLPLDYNECEKYYSTIYINGEISVDKILTKLVDDGIPTDFILLSIQPKNWNDDFTPWPAAAFRKGEDPPHGMADAYLSRLTNEIKPYMDNHYRTKPEPEHTALFGYSLGGLTAVYAIYKTDIFGVVGSLSGSLWFDDFCEFMGRKKPLRTDLRIYLSLGKKESRSKNPRMGRVAECTERAMEILRGQSNKVFFEWNEGGHFHDIEARFVKAIAWWV